MVPKHLSLLENFEDTNEFFTQLGRLLLQGKKLFVDFSQTHDLTVEAVLVFLAILREKAGRKRSNMVATAMGNSPLQNSPAARLLRESGFYEHVSSDLDLGAESGRGTIRPREGTRVNVALADALTGKAARAIFMMADGSPPSTEFLWRLWAIRNNMLAEARMRSNGGRWCIRTPKKSALNLHFTTAG